MDTPSDNERIAALIASGHLLPAVLSLEDLRRALRLPTEDAVLELHREEGLPLAKVGGRFLVSREAFSAWLNRRSGALLRAEPPSDGWGAR